MASSDLIRPPAVKFSEHVVTTIKHIQEQEYSVTASQCLSAGRRRRGRRKRVRHRVVRIIHIDGDATDSSGDDEAEVVQRVKRHVTEISFQPPPHERLVLRLPPPSGSGRKKFRGVRQRPWGRWAAEIRDPTRRKRLWLGTYDTPEEAATEYDKAAVRLKGPNAVTNFPNAVASAGQTQSGTCTYCIDAPSPTSVLRYHEETPFQEFGYGDDDDDDVNTFGFGFDVALTLPDIFPSKHLDKDEFGEFDPDDFLVF